MADPVSITKVTYTGLGLTISDTININYVLAFGIPDFATLTVVEEGVGTSLTFTQISAGILQVVQDGTTPASGTFVLTLDVPTDSFARSIENGNIFKEETIEDLFTQAMIISGSVAEGRLASLGQDLDFNGNKALNVGTGTLTTDGVNKGQMDTAIQAELSLSTTIKTDAEAARDTAIANAVLTAADVVTTNADVVTTNANVVLTNADVVSSGISATNANASALSAAASAAEGLYNNVLSKTFADSPLVPLIADEGTLYKVDTSGGNVVINLSELSVYAEDTKFAFVKETPDANTLTVNRGGTDTIEGGTTVVITEQYEVHILVGDLTTGEWIDVIQASTVADGSITTVKLADANVTEAKLATDTVSTVKIQDDAVTLAKMAGGTAGNMYIIDASGNPALMATGTAGQVATSNGVGVAPTMQDAGGGGAWELISSATASASASIDFTSGITSAYSSFMLVINNLIPSVDCHLNLRISTDGGSTFKSAASDYSWRVINSGGGSSSDVGDSEITMNTETSNPTALHPLSGTIFMSDLSESGSSTDNKSFNYDISALRNGTTAYRYMGSGLYKGDGTTAIDGLQILLSAGAITTGEFYLYGLKNT